MGGLPEQPALFLFSEALQGGELLSKTIKIRETKRDIRVLDKAGIAAEVLGAPE